MNVSVARNLAAGSAPRLFDLTAETAGADWDQFVLSRRDASGYHLWGWRRVFENAFGHEAIYLAAREHGRIAGVLPLVVFRSRLFGKFAVSLPFVNYGGVCAEDDEVAQALVAKASSLAGERGLAHVELRHIERQLPLLPARTHKVTMRLALGDDVTGTWEGLDRKVRNQVRKAEKSGLTARTGGVELLGAVYDVLAQNMRDLGTPVYSRRFFEEVVKTFPATATVCLVDHGDRTSRRRDCAVPPRRARGAVGFVAARVPQPVPEQPALLEDHRVRHRQPAHVARFRPLDAERGHLSLQGAVGRAA